MKLIYFENGNERFCYVIMQKDIAECETFSKMLEKGQYYDWETPYGYGGPLTDGHISDKTQMLFKSEIMKYCHKNKIISQFVRFHPLLKNHDILSQVIESRYLRDTIYIDTIEDETQIFINMDSKNRNMVRKAQKNNIIIQKRNIDEIDDFIEMYNKTMKRNGAEAYYTFKKDYFDYLQSMENYACIFYAMYEEKPISGAIIYYNQEYAHYHLAGSVMEYRKFSPNNLLLYEAACWAHKKGIKKFHLGGGMTPNDSLFGFKKQFNKNGRAEFWVGRTIFDAALYEKLLEYRKMEDDNFDKNNNFMIQYRG